MKMNKYKFIIPALAAGLFSGATAFAAEPTADTMITAENVDQYAEYLDPSRLTQVKMGMIIKVFPYSPVETLVYPKWLEMTHNPPKGPAVMLDEAGTWGLADGSYWPGGNPFPEPNSAREIMANFQYHLTQDDFDSDPVSSPMASFTLINAKGEIYKKQVLNLVVKRMTSRAFSEPLGHYPGFEDEFTRTNTLFFSPYDVRGLVSLNITYRDQAKLPDAYVYVPVLRRVRRQSSSQRADSVGGSDLTLGDVETFSDPLGMWDFKLLETKRMLGGLNNASGAPEFHEGKLKAVAGRYPTPYAAMEMRDIYVVEAIPRYDTIYSKKLLYIDKETFRPSNGEFFDRQGELLKSYAFYWNVGGDFNPDPHWIVIQNMQTNNETLQATFNLHGNTDTPLRRVLKANMKDFGR